jgi:hypothetical protein
LNDLAIVEIEETGEQFQKQIICCDIDLIDPTGSRVDVGDYIPNIIYINRETAKQAGCGGGGGGSHGMTKLEDMITKYETWFEKNDRLIGMFAGIKNGDEYLKVGQICLAINDSDDVLANIHADHINISSTSTAHMLSGSIVYDAQGRLVLKESSGGGIYTEHTNQGTTTTVGIWDKGNLTGGVMVTQINGQHGTKLTLKADVIDIDGLITALTTKSLTVASMTMTSTAYMLGQMTYQFIPVSWKSKTVVTSVGNTGFTKTFVVLDSNGGQTSWNHKVITDVSYNTDTIYYLGHS